MRRCQQFILALIAASAFAHAPTPVVSDTRGDMHGVFDPVDLAMEWNASRPTGYGAVPEYRPLSLKHPTS